MADRDLLLYVAHTASSVREQALYSIMSALAHAGERRFAVRVYTDAPEAFAVVAPELEFRTVTAAEVDAWTHPACYRHRVKPAIIREVASLFPSSRILFADADTVFTGPVGTLFDRITPGTAVMHEREYDVATSDLAVMHRFRRHMRRATFRGDPVDLDHDMWNSGAVGLHPDLFPVIDDWLAYLDEVFPRAKRWVLEQYALASLLQRRGIAIAEATDVVVHYWFDKDAYVSAISAALSRTSGLALDEALAFVRANPIDRPRRATSYGKPANFFQRAFGW